MKNNKKRIPPYVRSIYSISMLIACIFMSVGYAAMNQINMKISGSGIALNQTGMIITEVNYKENNHANTEKSEINQTTGSILNSTVVLSSTSSTSTITYTITIYNNNGYDSLFKSATFDESFYDNTNITYELSEELTTDTIVKAASSVTFDITFKYKDGITPSASTNTLNSYISFKFIRAPYVLTTYSTAGSYTYTIPEDGIYRIQLWGASGYNSGHESHAMGGYTQGDIELTSGTELHIYVGGKGKVLSSATKGTNDGGGYNGGGNANNDGHAALARYGGGGATDVRLVGGEWNLFDSLKSRIMVAGGGGSWSQSPNYGASAGGLFGYGDESDYSGSGGTQTSGGSGKKGLYGTSGSGEFGYGGDGSSYASGGGGGYYGGGGGARDSVDGSGGGGSSFISGHNGCDAITEESEEGNIIHTGQSIHYSGYQFTNTIMIDGNGYTWTNEKSESTLGYLPGYTDGTTLNLSSTKNGYAIIKRVPTE